MYSGNDNLYALTRYKRYKLRIVLENFDNVTKYASYDNFKTGSQAEKYILASVGQYEGTAG